MNLEMVSVPVRTNRYHVMENIGTTSFCCACSLNLYNYTSLWRNGKEIPARRTNL